MMIERELFASFCVSVLFMKYVTVTPQYNYTLPSKYGVGAAQEHSSRQTLVYLYKA